MACCNSRNGILNFQHIRMAEKQTTIFRQLIFNVVLPAIIALLLVGFLNYTNTKNLMVHANEEKNLIISDEITHILEFILNQVRIMILLRL